jgi:hypothetical protein
MSARGYKQTSSHPKSTSACTPASDIHEPMFSCRQIAEVKGLAAAELENP